MTTARRGLLAGVWLAGLVACATPAERVRREAAVLGLTAHTLHVNGFSVETFSRGEAASRASLHVYLEGDGVPWASLYRISPDPTPRTPLMLRMMRLDPAPALYLGRPCYYGHANDDGCSPLLWTQRRYAPEIVATMTQALRQVLAGQRRGLVFFGHSGGGALALLLARQFAETQAVVTFAGNLDIDRWADWHGYSRLQGSLNPAHDTGGAYAEWHYLGGQDTVMPPALLLPVLQTRQGAHIKVIADFSHGCCWESVLPEILPQLP